MISDQDSLNDIIQLLESDNLYTVRNTANLLESLMQEGYISTKYKKDLIKAYTRIISSVNYDYTADDILKITNNSFGIIIDMEKGVIIENNLTEEYRLLINDCVDALTMALHNPDDLIVYVAAHSLHYYGHYGTNAEPDLVDLLDNDDIRIRMCAAYSLAFINPGEYGNVIPVILDGIQNTNYIYLRSIAIQSLGNFEILDEDAIDTLIQIIINEDNVLRQKAIDVLIQMESEQNIILPKLSILLYDTNFEIACAAATIISKYNSEEASLIMETANEYYYENNIVIGNCIE
jgi:hypothetical protein